MKIKASNHQEKLWFVDEFERKALYDNGPVYHNIPLILRTNHVDINILNKSVQLLLDKHEVLRTKIYIEDGDLFQTIEDRKIVEAEVIQLSDTEDQDVLRKCFKIVDGAFNEGLNDSLFKVYKVLSKEQTFVILVFHFMICDNISKKIFRNDLVEIYSSLLNDIELENKEGDLQFLDFSEWQRNLPNVVINNQLLYWKMKIGKNTQAMELPIDRKRELIHLYEYKTIEFPIPVKLSGFIEDFSTKYNYERHIVYLAVFKMLLFKFSGLSEVTLGTTIDIRGIAGLDSVTGPVSNFVVLSDVITSESTVNDVIQLVSETYFNAHKNSLIPFDKLVSEIKPTIDMGRTALFDILFNYDTDDFAHDNFEEIESNLGWGKFDYNVLVSNQKGKVKLKVTYNSLYYDQTTVERMFNGYVISLERFLKNPDSLVSEVSVISDEEFSLIVNKWNDGIEAKVEKSIIELFMEQCAKHPEKTALTYQNDNISYMELNNRSSEVAACLNNQQIGRGAIVAVYLDRSIDCIVAILGILKAGAAYLPIDTTIPDERLNFILSDSNVEIIITNPTQINKLEGIKIIDIREILGKNTKISYYNSEVSPDDLAYIIYTSGTTGNPKGMMIEHRNLVNLILQTNKLFDLSYKDVWTMYHSPSFDFSVWEIFGALLTGARLVIVPRETTIEMNDFIDLLEKEKVTILNLTPIAFYNLLDQEKAREKDRIKISTIILGGEALNASRLKSWVVKYPNTQIINMYGITETTIHVTYKVITMNEVEESINNIGKPLPNYDIYILDTFNNILPIGVPGEIVVGGVGVGRGYLNRPELSVEKFIDNPFGKGRLYRSGDLARWLSDGDIEYIGRIDEQVKIRGFRIELGEIENSIRQISHIQDCAVIAREDPAGEKAIYAYIVSDVELMIIDVKDKLAESLPDYMIPAYIKQVDNIPLTRNGKLAKEDLPDIVIKSDKERIAPRDDMEKTVCDVFAEILGVEDVGINDSFFDFGGDSIKAIRVVSRLREKGYACTVKDIMKAKTVRVLSQQLNHLKQDGLESSNENVTGYVELTPVISQFFEQGFTKPEHYNWSMMLKNKQFNEKALKATLFALVKHHDMLRAIYKDEKMYIRDINEESLYSYEEYDLRKENRSVDNFVNDVCRRTQESIELEKGPLIKIVLFKTVEAEHLLIVIHHLVVDGVSWRIILEDFQTAYYQYIKLGEIQLPNKTLSFKEWSLELKEFATSERLKSERDYWEHIGRKIEELNCSRQSEFSYQTKSIEVIVDKEVTRKLLYKANNRFNTQISDLLLTSLGMTNRVLSGNDGLSLMLEGHGREELGNKRIEIDRTVGWFTSIYPVILETEEDIGQSIVKTKEMLRSIPGNGMGYGVLKYSGQIPVEQISPYLLFNYLGSIQEDKAYEDDSIMFSEYSAGEDIYEKNGNLYPVVVNILVEAEQLIIRFDYDTGRFEEDYLKKFYELYLENLKNIINYCIEDQPQTRTASDFKLTGMDLEEFNQIMRAVNGEE